MNLLKLGAREKKKKFVEFEYVDYTLLTGFWFLAVIFP